MLLKMIGFQGEIPRAHPRLLPDSYAQVAENLKLERGVLTPYRRPAQAHTLASSSEDTIYRHDGQWLSWPGVVDAVPGPVASDRLYITGDGSPKMHVNGITYDLAVPSPPTAPVTFLRTAPEWLMVGNRLLSLKHGRTGASFVAGTGGLWSLTASVKGSTATVTCTHPGATPAATGSMINSVKFRHGRLGVQAVIPSLKIVKITRIKDNGGQSFDANQNPVGSDTTLYESLGSVVRAGGTPLDISLGTHDPGDTTDNAGQNDPPVVETTPLNPDYPTAGVDMQVFSGTTVNAIEPGQEITLVEFTIEGLSNGGLWPLTQETLAYAYTYVTQFGEESAPSPLSTVVNWSPGHTVRVQGMTAPPGGRGFNAIRVYRAQTSAVGQTDLYFIAEIAAATAFSDDNPLTVPAQEPIGTIDFTGPPEALRGLIAIPGGTMVGFVGKQIFFSEPYQPHAWPQKYALSVDFQVVGLASIGTAIAVMTTGSPYIIAGSHPDSMRMDRIEVNYPCLSRRSIVDLGYFAAYASTSGLVTLSSGGAQLITSALFTPRQWQDLGIATFICSQHEGRYVISHNPLNDELRRCTIIDLTGADPYVVRTTWRPRAFFFDIGTGQLFYLEQNQIIKFDSPTSDFERMRWRSKQFTLTSPTAFSCMMIDGESVFKNSKLAVRVYADGRLVATIGTPNRVVRLPDDAGKCRRWEIEVTGTFQVSAVYLAESPDEIANAA